MQYNNINSCLYWLQLNLGFLCNILRALIFQLHSHPQEPSNFRFLYVNAILLRHRHFTHSNTTLKYST